MPSGRRTARASVARCWRFGTRPCLTQPRARPCPCFPLQTTSLTTTAATSARTCRPHQRVDACVYAYVCLCLCLCLCMLVCVCVCRSLCVRLTEEGRQAAAIRAGARPGRGKYGSAHAAAPGRVCAAARPASLRRARPRQHGRNGSALPVARLPVRHAQLGGPDAHAVLPSSHGPVAVPLPLPHRCWYVGRPVARVPVCACVCMRAFLSISLCAYV
jgi:hypothetical protein